MRILRELWIKIAAGLVVGIILMWLFQPELYEKGVSKMVFLLQYIKILLGICILAIWLYWLIHSKTKKMINYNLQLKKDIEILQNKRFRGDHFYTIDMEERDNAVSKHGYKIDVNKSIACYVFPVDKNGITKEGEKPVPLYRLWAE